MEGIGNQGLEDGGNKPEGERGAGTWGVGALARDPETAVAYTCRPVPGKAIPPLAPPGPVVSCVKGLTSHRAPSFPVHFGDYFSGRWNTVTGNMLLGNPSTLRPFEGWNRGIQGESPALWGRAGSRRGAICPSTFHLGWKSPWCLTCYPSRRQDFTGTRGKAPALESVPGALCKPRALRL